MTVCIDEAVAVGMHDKVRKHWDIHREGLEASLAKAAAEDRPVIEAKIETMRTTDMAVVVSQNQNEIRELGEKGLDIRPHRKRMIEEDLDERFRDAKDPLRLVFVYAI